MCFSLSANILVVSSILLGGVAAINAITGMSVYAALYVYFLSIETNVLGLK